MIRREPTDEEKAEFLAQSGEELCYMLENKMPENGQEVLRQLARVSNQCVQEVVEKCEGLLQPVSESIAITCEQLGDLELPDLPRPPAEIRKDIKHEKNPLRLRQLNKELNESCKACKRKRGRKDGRKFRRI